MIYTRQEVFNKVWDRAKDKVKAIDGDTDYQCRYRAPNGKACFLGVLIPDDKYTPEMEYAGSIACNETVLQFFGMSHCSENRNDIQFLYNLQRIHDFSDPNLWEQELSKIAIEY